MQLLCLKHRLILMHHLCLRRQCWWCPIQHPDRNRQCLSEYRAGFVRAANVLQGANRP
jgi:hypothetical protein